jgi:hypothetical protein
MTSITSSGKTQFFMHRRNIRYFSFKPYLSSACASTPTICESLPWFQFQTPSHFVFVLRIRNWIGFHECLPLKNRFNPAVIEESVRRNLCGRCPKPRVDISKDFCEANERGSENEIETKSRGNRIGSNRRTKTFGRSQPKPGEEAKQLNRIRKTTNLGK